MALRSLDDGATPPRLDLLTAVRYTLGILERRHPGRSVEVRVPPAGAVQIIEGLSHKRGTPPNVVELKPDVWLRLTTGRLTWAEAFASGSILASGTRADLSEFFPVAVVEPGAAEGDRPDAGSPAGQNDSETPRPSERTT